MDIMLVDDEMLIVKGLSTIICRQYSDVTVRTFTDPFEALNAIGKQKPHLLITDIKMPGMTGLELIDKLRDLGVCSYAVLTGLDDVPLLQESIRLQVADYLIKPVNRAELFALIDRTRNKILENQKKESNSLVRSFCAADRPDEEIIGQLTTQLKRSDCPPDVLYSFLTESGRDIRYWDACALSGQFLKSENAGSLAQQLRSLPLLVQVSSPVIRQVLQSIADNYTSNITLTSVAAEVFLQPNYLTTLFRKEAGISFVQYLNRFRIEEACKLILKKPNLSLAEIAQSTGFPSARYFFSSFRKFTGTTPGQFRSDLIAAGFIASGE